MTVIEFTSSQNRQRLEFRSNTISRKINIDYGFLRLKPKITIQKYALASKFIFIKYELNMIKK